MIDYKLQMESKSKPDPKQQPSSPTLPSTRTPSKTHPRRKSPLAFKSQQAIYRTCSRRSPSVCNQCPTQRVRNDREGAAPLDCNKASEEEPPAIKLAIHTSEKNSTRVCKLRGLVGSRKEVRHFIDTFRIKSAVLIKQQPFYMEENEQILDEPENPFHLEACAAYMFHKILSN